MQKTRVGVGLITMMCGTWCALMVLACHAQGQEHAEWNEPRQPFQIFGNTYFVGTRGLSAILITSSEGAVLIDAALPESAEQIAKNIATLGIRLRDVKWILNSHVHVDHAGGISELQRRTGAKVAALRWSAGVLRTGRKDPGDPQFAATALPAERVADVRTIDDGEKVRLGGLALLPHRTGGHTPGGTSWTWRSCDAGRCVDFVYADSMTAVSADGFRFADSQAYPQAIDDFGKSIDWLRVVSCDILLTPHPDASEFWKRIARRDDGERDALIDRTQCGRYAARAAAQLEQRLEQERRR